MRNSNRTASVIKGGQVFIPFSTTSASIVLSLPLYSLIDVLVFYSIVAKAFLINQASWAKCGRDDLTTVLMRCWGPQKSN